MYVFDQDILIVRTNEVQAVARNKNMQSWFSSEYIEIIRKHVVTISKAERHSMIRMNNDASAYQMSSECKISISAETSLRLGL